jgi:hypothetical protein
MLLIWYFGILKASTASAVWNGAVATVCRCVNSCGLVIARGYRITPGSAGPAAVCLWKSTTRCSPGCRRVWAGLGEHGRIKGERIGLDASTMEASAALRAIVRRDSGEGYREMLAPMARESGIETPTADDLIRLDRNRKSNADWESPTDPDARIAKLKDGCPRLAYKPEHAMDLDTGAVIAADLHPADQGDTPTMAGTLASAVEHLASGGGRRPPRSPRN